MHVNTRTCNAAVGPDCGYCDEPDRVTSSATRWQRPGPGGYVVSSRVYTGLIEYTQGYTFSRRQHAGRIVNDVLTEQWRCVVFRGLVQVILPRIAAARLASNSLI